jgi:hypothetical protein
MPNVLDFVGINIAYTRISTFFVVHQFIQFAVVCLRLKVAIPLLPSADLQSTRR